MFSKITANLIVPSVNDALDFYERILGFGLVMAVPAGSQEIVTARVGDAPLAFAIIGARRRSAWRRRRSGNNASYGRPQ